MNSCMLLSLNKCRRLAMAVALLFAQCLAAEEPECAACATSLSGPVSAICRAKQACKVAPSQSKVFFAMSEVNACSCDCGNAVSASKNLKETCSEALVDVGPWGLIAAFQDGKWVATFDLTQVRSREPRFVPAVLLNFEQGAPLLMSTSNLLILNGSFPRRADELRLGDTVEVLGSSTKVRSVNRGYLEIRAGGPDLSLFFTEILNRTARSRGDYEYLPGIGKFHTPQSATLAPNQEAGPSGQDKPANGTVTSAVVNDFARAFDGVIKFELAKDSPIPDASAGKLPGHGDTCHRVVRYNDGLVTYDESHRGVLAAMLAHEVGHYYAGIAGARNPFCSTSCEDRADYWGALVAYRLVYPGADGAMALLKAQPSLAQLFELRGSNGSDPCAHPPASCRLNLFEAAARGDPFPECNETPTTSKGVAP